MSINLLDNSINSNHNNNNNNIPMTPNNNPSINDSNSSVRFYRSKKRSPTKIHKIPTREMILEILQKPKLQRNKTDIRFLSDFLSLKYDYFTKLKNPADLPKLEKLCTVVNLESFAYGESIINFGDEGEKFYIVLKGTVGIFLPSYPQKDMMIRDYIAYLKKILYEEENQLKYNRIVEKNIDSKLDLDFLLSINFENDQGRREMMFTVEEYYKVNEGGDGFTFGEIALIKKSKRNATITVLSDDCKVLSIEKSDYNKIIRELEEKRLAKELNDFKKTYPLFEHWTLNHLIRLFNCFSKQILTKGDYLYKQNEESDSVYIILNGTFEVYSMISLGWVDEFYKYIKDAQRNLVFLLGKTEHPLKEKQLRELYSNTLMNAQKSPCQYDPLKTVLGSQSQVHKDNILEITKEEEDMKDPFNLFKVFIKVINYKDVIGIEDALEVKKRFYFVKCTSPFAEVQKVKLYDFYRLVNLNPEASNKNTLMSIIAEKKSIFYMQIKKYIQGMTVKCKNKYEAKFVSFLNERKIRKPPIKLLSLKKINDIKKKGDNEDKDKEMREISIKGYDAPAINMKTLFNNTKSLITDKKIQLRLFTNNGNINNNITPKIIKHRKHLHQSANSLITIPNNTYNDLTYSNTHTQTYTVGNNSYNNPKTHSRVILSKRSDSLLSRNHPHPISNFLQFNNNKPIRTQGVILKDTQPHSLVISSSISRNYIGQHQHSINDDRRDYRQHLMSDYKALETEIYKMTGITKLKPKVLNNYNYYANEDAKVIQIESYNKRKNRNDNGSCVDNCKTIAHKKANSYHIEIQMKNYKFLRRSVRLLNLKCK